MTTVSFKTQVLINMQQHKDSHLFFFGLDGSKNSLHAAQRKDRRIIKKKLTYLYA